MPILNYTSKVGAAQTASQIQQTLAKKGALRVAVDYDPQGDPSAVEFCIHIHKQPVNFRLPCNVSGVLRAMENNGGVPKRLLNKEQAQRAAWRILKNWIDVQMAMVEANQVEMAEIFLPYAIDSKGETMYQLFKESKQKQLSS